MAGLQGTREVVHSDLKDTLNLLLLFQTLPFPSINVLLHMRAKTHNPYCEGGRAAFSVTLPHRAHVYFAFVQRHPS